MWILSFVLYVSVIFGQRPTNEDFLELQKALRFYVSANPSFRVPKLVRLSFHDLASFNPTEGQGGPHGCIAESRIKNFKDNRGLKKSIFDLPLLIKGRFFHHNFTFGDVISLAGKVAVEEAYPCIQIPWRYGRLPCPNDDEKPEFPSGFIRDYSSNDTDLSLKPFLERYGFTASEMAVLTIGAHAVRKASAHRHNSGFGDFAFSLINSGKDWILKSLNPDLWVKKSRQFESSNGLMRLPSDMMFFPTVVDSIPGYPAPQKGDPHMLPVEDYLRELASKDRFVFDKEFERVYSKMLEIGVKTETLKPFVEPLRKLECKDEYGSGSNVDLDLLNKV